jgi:hypothetical protein
MAYDVPNHDLETTVASYLELTEPRWTCRACIMRAERLTEREVKVALLRLGRFRSKDYIETGYDVCEGCGATTAVVRLGRRGRIRRVA